MNLLQFSQIPRYKLVRQNAENGWGRSTVYTDLLADDRGEWMRVSDVRDLVVGDRPAPNVAALVEALEAAQKEAVRGINHARNGAQAASALGRVSAICGAALAAHRKGGDA